MTNQNNNNRINPKDHTILIVDDEADLREILVMQFQSRGFNTFEAANGAEALEVVNKNKIDLVITDIRMPGGNGVELLDNLRKKDNEVPVVMFISGHTEITLEEAFKKGAEAIFSKPFDQNVLVKTVLESLAPRKAGWTPRAWRGETSLPLEITVEGQKTVMKAHMENLSLGGLFARIDNVIPEIGSKLKIKIKPEKDDKHNFDVEGVVRWIRAQFGEYPKGCGVEFLSLNENASKSIHDLINFLKTQQHVDRKGAD